MVIFFAVKMVPEDLRGERPHAPGSDAAEDERFDRFDSAPRAFNEVPQVQIFLLTK